MATSNTGTSRTPTRPVSGGDDTALVRVAEVTDWSRRNSRAIVIGAIVVALAGAAALYYVNYRSEMAARAATELLDVRQTAATADLPTAVAALEGFIDRFGSTDAGAEARLLLAQLQLAAGNAAQAAEAVRPVADSRDPIMSASAGLLLAGALEASGQVEEAERAYLRVADDAELGFQQREALEDAARIRVQLGNRAGAVELYDRLIGMTEEGSPDRDVYQMRRAEITAAN